MDSYDDLIYGNDSLYAYDPTYKSDANAYRDSLSSCKNPMMIFNNEGIYFNFVCACTRTNTYISYSLL